MAKVHELIEQIHQGVYDAAFTHLYGQAHLDAQRARYIEAIKEFAAEYGDGREVSLYSAPGRTEIGGNHVDHNNGVVMAAAVDLDIIAVVSKNDENIVRVKSQGDRKSVV